MNRHPYKTSAAFNLAAGFTLTEVLIAMAIVGILSAVAIPQYTSYTLRASRTEAKSTLLQVASDQERFYSINRTYSTNAAPLDNPVAASVTSTNGKYIVTVAACGSGTIATCFLATATAQGGQTSDECGNLTLTNAGVRSSSAGVAADCWAK